jgi:hypothetical protein
MVVILLQKYLKWAYGNALIFEGWLPEKQYSPFLSQHAHFLAMHSTFHPPTW